MHAGPRAAAPNWLRPAGQRSPAVLQISATPSAVIDRSAATPETLGRSPHRGQVRAEAMSHPVHDVLRPWKAAFDGHQPDAMADLFPPDTHFQRFGPRLR